ncbi:MAG: thiamine-phosphate kinase [Silvibacterium sp.]
MTISTFRSETLGERALIAALRSRVRGSSYSLRRSVSGLRLGIGDDCAIVRPGKGEEIVVTTDFSLEGVHFRRDWHTPESVGHRCLARGLSDLAAMGARPVAAFLSLAVPDDLLAARRGKSWVERFFDGLLALADRHEVPLAGGDTARAPERACFDIVLLGAVGCWRALLRSGAKAGDLIYVSGALGGAAAELLALERGPRRFAGLTKAVAGHPHLYPEPRLIVAARLAVKRVHSAIDISDGLSTDLAHICDESGLPAELDAWAIPVHPLAIEAARAGWVSSALDLALHGGEDYELLFTASPEMKIPRSIAGVPLYRIGRMLPRRARRPLMVLRDGDGQVTAIEPRGWEHFR